MDYRLTRHARERMASRGIQEEDLEAALGNIPSTADTPQDSTCIVGITQFGELKIWIVGGWPQDGVLVVKSTAWKGDGE